MRNKSVFAFPLSLTHLIAELGIRRGCNQNETPSVNLEAIGLRIWKPNKGTITSSTDLGTQLVFNRYLLN